MLKKSGLYIGVAILALVLAAPHSRAGNAVTPDTLTPPIVTKATPIAPKKDQTITITGSHLGKQAPYTGDSAYIFLWDITGRWSAGLDSPEIFDTVGLKIRSWEENKIVIEGFTGAYDRNGPFVLIPGDIILIYITNPQNKVPADSWVEPNDSGDPLVSVCLAVVGSGKDCIGPN